MTSSPTRASPTRSRPADRRRRPRLAALLLAAAPLAGWAHGEADQALPEAPGARLRASAVVTQLDTEAGAALPTGRLPGFLLQGDAGRDPRGLALEHGVVEAAWRASPAWGAALAAGRHGSDPTHVEGAWVRYAPDGPAGAWQLDVGRQRPALGAVLTPAGHMDRYALMPLAKQAVLNGDWIDDGAQLRWRGGPDGRPWHLAAGLWRARVFPGAPQGEAALSLQSGLAWHDAAGHWALDGLWVHLRPRARGAVVASANGGHSHATPDCSESRLQRVCFDGRADVLGASLRWQSARWPLRLDAAGLWRGERGTLDSANGLADYRGRQAGAWVEALWQPAPRWELGARLERAQAAQRLQGAGASLLAVEAGFDRYAPAHRVALMAGWQPHPQLALRLEAGREAAGGQRVPYAALRAVLHWQRDSR